VNDLLFFCGEATAFHTNPQTVHGAIETGIRAANQVKHSLSLKKNSKL